MSLGTESKKSKFYAGIEGGGTTWKCVFADQDCEIINSHSIPTDTPEKTLQRVVQFYESCQKEFGEISGIGVGSFGPANIDINSSNYGQITSTPKLGWSYFNVVKALEKVFAAPVLFDTDVNVAARAEYEFGNASGLNNFAYVTVGTGIGVSVYMNGSVAQGDSHFESGHMLVPKHDADANFDGVCQFHSGCLEGLASGPSIEKRWNQNPKNLPDDHIAWDIESYYLGILCMNLSLVYRPRRIILGGGVMNRKCLFEKIREQYSLMMASYIGPCGLLQDYITSAGLIENSGVKGAVLLAQDASLQKS